MAKKNIALYVCVVAFFSVLLSVGKWVLALVPNFEVVTLTVALVAYVWGIAYALPSVLVFVAMETVFLGFNVWVIEYLVHWQAVAILFATLSKVNLTKCKTLFLTLCAVFITVAFGLMTSAVDTLVAFVPSSGFVFAPNDFAERFAVVYVSGVPFYLVQTVCNAVLFATVFAPLEKLNRKIKRRMTQQTDLC